VEPLHNWKLDYKQLWNDSGGRIIGSVLIGLAVGVIMYFFYNKLPNINEIIFSVLVSIIAYLGFIVKDTTNIYKLRNRLDQAKYTYDDLINSHFELPVAYYKFINQRLTEDSFTKKGLIFINVYDEDYRNWLNTCSINAKDSFCATLADSYFPSIFFREDNKGNLNSDSIKNLEYLDKTNKLNIAKKYRIFMYSKKDFVEDLKKLKLTYLRQFFLLQNNFHLYFIDPNEIKNSIDSKKYFGVGAVISSDFAMFDNSLVFRRIGNVELAYYFTKGSDNKIPNPFSQLFSKEILNENCVHALDEIKEHVINNDVTENEEKEKIINNLISLINYDKE